MAKERFFTEEIECPHCGHVVVDSWELESDDDTYECDCGLTFRYTRHTTVSYNSVSMEDDDEK